MPVSAAATTASSSSFLTEQQRAALDAALAQKAAEHDAVRHAHNRVAAGERKSRAGKGTGLKGTGAKGGGGGKFTWGSILTDGDQAERVLDSRDPNYDSEEEKTIVLQTQHQRLRDEVKAYKEEVKDMVLEYFSSGDIGDVAERLEDLGATAFMHYFVKRLITSALDHHNREREMASVLLSSLYSNVIPPEQVVKGFVALIDGIGDLVLDVPDAANLLALFVARGVVDDVLPPAIVARIPDDPPAAKALRAKVEAHLSARHAAEKVLRCWGSGAGKTHADTRDSIVALLAEFESSGDVEEAARCLNALSVPFFHHEVVKQAVHRAMAHITAAPAQAQALVDLLLRLSETGEVSAAQLRKGLARVTDGLEDLKLDDPAAQDQWASVQKLLRAAGLLELQDDAELLARRMSNTSVATTAGTTQPSTPALHSVAAFKEAASTAVREYFDSSDAAEVARRLTETGDPGLMHIFVKVAVVASLDRRARERELVSALLAELHPEVLSDAAAAAGFTRLLAATDDLVLDCPDAVHLLALFLGRAIVDEVLPPAFLTQVLDGLHSDSLALGVVKTAGSILGARHGAERMANAWHGGALSLDQIKTEMRSLVAEYLASSHDVGEVARSLGELGVPAYHHQLVVVALELAFSGGDKAVNPVCELLAALGASGVVSQTQMVKGFERVSDSMADEALDYGKAAAGLYARIREQGLKAGWLQPDSNGSTA